MADENELNGTQAAPEGETVETTGTDTAPEQTNDELNTDTEQGDEGGKPEGTEQEEAEKPKPKPTFYEKRFGELTFEKREAQRERDEARAELARLKAGNAAPVEEPEEQPVVRQQPAASDDDITRRARELNAQTAHADRVGSLINAGNSAFEKEAFTHKSNLVASIAGNRVHDLMTIVTDPEIVTDGHKVIAALADQPEEAERILGLPSVKMALELTKLSEKLSKPTSKPISKVPAPVEPINGAARTATRLDDPNMPMDEFGPAFLKNLAGKRR